MKELFILLVIVFVICAVESTYCPSNETSPSCLPCPPDRPWTNCNPDPCEREKENGCPLHKDATCRSKPCGGCYDEWFLADGKQVWCWA